MEDLKESIVILGKPYHLVCSKALDHITMGPVAAVMVIASADYSSKFRIGLDVV